VAFLEKLRTRRSARRHAHDEQLAAEARGEAAAIHSGEELARSRYGEDEEYLRAAAVS
jgi:hypothetical protein